MMKFGVYLGEALDVRYGVSKGLGRVWGRISRRIRADVKYWYWGCVFLFQDLSERFGRSNKKSHTFTWWTYYVAVTRSLRHARMAKYSWGRSIDAWTVCAFYDRYEGVQKRARERGYVKLASEDIHDKWVLKGLVEVE